MAGPGPTPGVTSNGSFSTRKRPRSFPIPVIVPGVKRTIAAALLTTEPRCMLRLTS
jgi:hypothetical protein